MRTSQVLPQVDTTSPTLRYIQAKNILAQAIQGGAFQAGTKLPSTSEISLRLNVSLITAHKAIQCLVEEGWLRRERGRGTFVRDDFQQSVAAKPKFRVALVLPGEAALQDYYHVGVLAGLRHAAEFAEPVGELTLRRSNSPADLNRIRADGYLCLHPSLDCFAEIEELAQRKPIVVLGSSRPGTSLDCVDCQNHAAARDAVRHLVKLGHQRIAIVNGPLTQGACVDRQGGYASELVEQGLPVHAGYIVNALPGQAAPAVMPRVQEMMQASDRPTAILACSYDLALETMLLLRRLALAIPQDVSLVGFEDPKSASLLNPALTTVHLPLDEMGARAYRRIVQMINGQNGTPRIELLPSPLVIRDSTAPPAA